MSRKLLGAGSRGAPPDAGKKLEKHQILSGKEPQGHRPIIQVWVLSSAQASPGSVRPLLWAVPDVSRGLTIAPIPPTQAIG